MNTDYKEQIIKYRKRHVRKKRWEKIVTVLASIVVFGTTYALILPAITMEQATYCGYEEHIAHTDESCFGAANELVCEKTLHEHTLQCFSDPNADVENSSIWESTICETTGRYAEDVLAIAKSQLGYKESTKNYQVQEDQITQKGYTRYGAWYGDPYGDWNCMFTSFCIHYAGIQGNIMPISSDVNEWIAYIGGNERYITDGLEEIAAGDIAFIDIDWDGIPDASAVVESVNEEDISVVQGDVNDTVAKMSYVKDQMMGYFDLTEEISDDADSVMPEATTIHATASDGTEVAVSGEIPENADVTLVPVDLSEQELSEYIRDGVGMSLQQYTAYDITIYVDGIEWQPDQTVSVAISSSPIQMDKDDSIEVMHVDEYGNTEAIEAEVMPNGDVLFHADGFSLYIIYTYTVDFHYSDFTYSLQGGDNIFLSELFNALEIDVDLKDIRNIEFSDESLIRLEKILYEDGMADWRLFSLKSFDTDEELIITMNNGEVIRIYVVDPPDGDSTPISPTEAPDIIGPDPNGIGNTQWQITKEEYAGREQSNKIPVDSDGDGKTDVWIQKNVVPTETENEFLVYLSIDTMMNWEQFLNDSRIGLTTSARYKKAPIGSIYDHIVGNTTAELSEHGNQGTYTNQYYIRFRVFQDHNSTTPLYTYYDWRYGKTSNCSNATAFMTIPGVGCVVVAKEVNLHAGQGTGQGDPLVIDLYLDALDMDFSFYRTDLETVTDEVGNQIEVIDFEANHICDGTASYDDSTHTITWYPDDNSIVIPDIDSSPISAWMENVSQLVYRVRLNVQDEDFVPCADTIDNKADSIAAGESFRVNNSAVLEYNKIALPQTSGSYDEYGLTATFPVPEVRGLLYDITFIKLNEDGRQLADAVFSLYQSDGTTPVLDKNGNPMTLSTTTNKISRFPNLTYGTYVLKEVQAPNHYSPPAQNAWTVRLCYTDASTLQTPDISPYEHNMRYMGNDMNGQWRITNSRIPFHYALKIIKVDDAANPLADAGFSIADPEHDGQMLTGETAEDGTYLFNAPFAPDTAYELSEVTPPDGYFSLPAGIQFRVNEDLSSDSYTAVFLNSGDFAGNVSLNLRELESGSNTQYVLEVTVQNQGVYELPATGGPGSLIYTLSGIVLLGTTLLISFGLRRKGEKKSVR